MKLALDTNAYRAHSDRSTRLAALVRKADLVGVPIIVLGELRFGFLNGTRLQENEEQLGAFMRTPRVRILDLDLETTWQFGEIATQLRRAGKALAQNDIWIAALCKRHAYTLATRDEALREVLGLQVISF